VIATVSEAESKNYGVLVNLLRNSARCQNQFSGLSDDELKNKQVITAQFLIESKERVLRLDHIKPEVKAKVNIFPAS
jgi:hypothetical protein